MRPNICRWRRLCAVVFGLFPVSLSFAQSGDFRFYVGVDVQIPQDDQVMQVSGYSGHALLVKGADAKPGVLPLSSVGAYRWARYPKVSRAVVKIDDFKADRAFTVRTDPQSGWMQQQNTMAVYSQELGDMQLASVNRAQEEAQFLAGGELEAPYGADPSAPTAHEHLEKAFNNFEVGAFAINANNEPTTWNELRANDDSAPFDTIELTFTVSAEEPIARSYAVVIAQVEGEDGAGTMALFEDLGAIGPEPRKVRIRRPGLEPGFKLNEVKVHVYSHGKELGTNLSDRVTGLTREQARSYLELAHAADNRTGNVLPVPVWELAPAALFANADASRYDFAVAVSIGSKGEVLAIHQTVTEAYEALRVVDLSDVNTKATPGESGPAQMPPATVRDAAPLDRTGQLPAHVVAAINDFVFLPALKDGKPVKGIISFNLADFYR